MRNASAMLDHRAGRLEARRLRLEAISSICAEEDVEDAETEEHRDRDVPPESSRKDSFGLDLDEFMSKSPRKT